MSENDDTTKALIKSIGVMDASRRVGWAKAFAAEESADEAHRISALTAGDRDAYRRGSSFLWGIVQGITQGLGAPDIKDHLFTETGDLEMLLDPKVTRRGYAKGQSLAAQMEALVARREQKLEIKRSSRKLDASFKQGQRRGIAMLAQSHGFRDADEMEVVLEKFRQASGRSPHKGAVKIGRYMVGRNSERRMRKSEGADPLGDQ